MNVRDMFDEVAPIGVNAYPNDWAQNGANGDYEIVVRLPNGELARVDAVMWDHEDERAVLETSWE